MSKNTLLAFVLIMVMVTLFMSPGYQKFFHEKVYPRKPFPTQQERVKEQQEESDKTRPETAVEPGAGKGTVGEEPSLKAESGDSAGNVVGSSDTAGSVAGSIDTVWAETDRLRIGITELGGRVVSVRTKEYRYSGGDTGATELRKKGEMVELVPRGSAGGAQLSIAGVSYDGSHFEYEGESGETVVVSGGQEKVLVFTHQDPSYGTIRKLFSLKNGAWEIGYDIEGERISGQRVTVGWLGGLEESEENQGSRPEQRRVHWLDEDGNLSHLAMGKAAREAMTGRFKWVGVTSKYFLVGLVNDTVSDADVEITGFQVGGNSEEKSGKKAPKDINYGLSYQETAEANRVGFWIYAGPTKFSELNKYGLEFEKVLFPVLGVWRHFFFADRWFPWVAELVLWVLLVLYRIVRDYGVAILLLTILSRVVTYPLSASSIKSMNKMKDVQPKVNALRQRYKNNPKKMNEELMALYRTEGINPFNPGCLPIFLQMPVFIALFVVLRKAIELRGTGTVLVPWVKDLSQPEVLFSLKGILPNGIPMYGANFALLPIIMAVLTYFQNKMTIKDPNQKAMIYFMPIFMLVLFNNFPSGLVLYWTLSSALGLVQQWYTTRKSSVSVVPANSIQTRSNARITRR